MDKYGKLPILYSGSGKERFLGLKELEQSELDWVEKSRCPGAQPLRWKPPRLRTDDEGDREVTAKGLETVSSIQILQ